MDHVQVFPDGELNVQAAASRDTSPSFARPSVQSVQHRGRHMQEAIKLQTPSRQMSVPRNCNGTLCLPSDEEAGLAFCASQVIDPPPSCKAYVCMAANLPHSVRYSKIKPSASTHCHACCCLTTDLFLRLCASASKALFPCRTVANVP